MVKKYNFTHRLRAQFDTKTTGDSMGRRKSKIDFDHYAERYGVSSRTCRRWHAAGADLDNSESVANVILRQNRPCVETLKTLEENLKES